MTNIVAFLQIIQILGRWTWGIIKNFHVVSVIILIHVVLNYNGLNPLEIFALFYLVIWFLAKKGNIGKRESKQTIKIENQHSIQIINNNEMIKTERAGGEK